MKKNKNKNKRQTVFGCKNEAITADFEGIEVFQGGKNDGELRKVIETDVHYFQVRQPLHLFGESREEVPRQQQLCRFRLDKRRERKKKLSEKERKRKKEKKE